MHSYLRKELPKSAQSKDGNKSLMPKLQPPQSLFSYLKVSLANMLECVSYSGPNAEFHPSHALVSLS
jgi:hypothetical protein